MTGTHIRCIRWERSGNSYKAWMSAGRWMDFRRWLCDGLQCFPSFLQRVTGFGCLFLTIPATAFLVSLLISPRVCIPSFARVPWSTYDVVTYNAQSCPTLCGPMDCSPPGSSVHGISQARTLEWVANSSSRGSSRPRDQTHVSCTEGQYFIMEPPGKPISSSKLQ